MKEFKIGQVVRVVDSAKTRCFNLDTLGFIGKQFTVAEVVGGEGIGEVVYAVHAGFFVPPETCELVTDVPPKADYAEMVAALAKPGEVIKQELTAKDCHTLHMAVGICGEAGELLDAVKKASIYRKPIDFENVIEELGDLEFYMEGLRQGFGITREQTIQANIDKLSVRYAGLKYSDQAAQDRADKVE